MVSGELGDGVLDEDEWTASIRHIVQRDYFPELAKLRGKVEWLEAVRSGDPERIARAQASAARTVDRAWLDEEGVPAVTADPRDAGALPSRAAIEAPSLDAFLANRRGEDDESFRRLLDAENAARTRRALAFPRPDTRPARPVEEGGGGAPAALPIGSKDRLLLLTGRGEGGDVRDEKGRHPKERAAESRENASGGRSSASKAGGDTGGANSPLARPSTNASSSAARSSTNVPSSGPAPLVLGRASPRLATLARPSQPLAASNTSFLGPGPGGRDLLSSLPLSSAELRRRPKGEGKGIRRSATRFPGWGGGGGGEPGESVGGVASMLSSAFASPDRSWRAGAGEAGGAGGAGAARGALSRAGSVEALSRPFPSSSDAATRVARGSVGEPSRGERRSPSAGGGGANGDDRGRHALTGSSGNAYDGRAPASPSSLFSPSSSAPVPVPPSPSISAPTPALAREQLARQLARKAAQSLARRARLGTPSAAELARGTAGRFVSSRRAAAAAAAATASSHRGASRAGTPLGSSPALSMAGTPKRPRPADEWGAAVRQGLSKRKPSTGGGGWETPGTGSWK